MNWGSGLVLLAASIAFGALISIERSVARVVTALQRIEQNNQVRHNQVMLQLIELGQTALPNAALIDYRNEGTDLPPL